MLHCKVLVCDHLNGRLQSKFSELIVNEKYDIDCSCDIYGSRRKYILLEFIFCKSFNFIFHNFCLLIKSEFYYRTPTTNNYLILYFISDLKKNNG